MRDSPTNRWMFEDKPTKQEKQSENVDCDENSNNDVCSLLWDGVIGRVSRQRKRQLVVRVVDCQFNWWKSVQLREFTKRILSHRLFLEKRVHQKSVHLLVKQFSLAFTSVNDIILRSRFSDRKGNNSDRAPTRATKRTIGCIDLKIGCCDDDRRRVDSLVLFCVYCIDWVCTLNYYHCYETIFELKSRFCSVCRITVAKLIILSLVYNWTTQKVNKQLMVLIRTTQQ